MVIIGFFFPFPIIILCFVIIIFVRPFLCLDYVLGVLLLIIYIIIIYKWV